MGTNIIATQPFSQFLYSYALVGSARIHFEHMLLGKVMARCAEWLAVTLHMNS